jgi:hypothetical protein
VALVEQLEVGGVQASLGAAPKRKHTM